MLHCDCDTAEQGKKYFLYGDYRHFNYEPILSL